MSPQELERYIPIADFNAQANLERVTEKSGADVKRLNNEAMDVAMAVMPISQKLKRLRFIAGQWSSRFTPHTACAKACTHCCNVAVDVTAAEAQVIAKEIGVRAATPNKVRHVSEENPDEERWLGVPCTFLGEAGCRIYSSRPLMCRTQVNMDSDERLCRIVKGVPIPVPYANATTLKGALAFVAQRDAGLADIREWFPDGLGRESDRSQATG